MTFSIFSGGRKINDEIPLTKFLSEGVGIFESLRVYQGKIFRLEEHLTRFMESAKTAGIAQVPSIKMLRRELETATEAFHKKEAWLRLTLVQDQIFVMAGERVHPKRLYEQGVALQTSPVKRSLSNAAFPEIKTTAYQNAVFATLEPRPEKIYEWLFLDAGGFITEVRIGNIFMIKKFSGPHVPAEIVTPPLLGILNGVTRRFVIECASQSGIKVSESPLTRHDLFNAGEAFLTNTSWEILPVRELDGRRIGGQIPGPITKDLHRIFRKKVNEECQT
jgi:branched-chain amino acid aminotransferase